MTWRHSRPFIAGSWATLVWTSSIYCNLFFILFLLYYLFFVSLTAKTAKERSLLGHRPTKLQHAHQGLKNHGIIGNVQLCSCRAPRNAFFVTWWHQLQHLLLMITEFNSYAAELDETNNYNYYIGGQMDALVNFSLSLHRITLVYLW